MKIPDSLINDINHGRVILFLGAGASIGAKHPRNEQIPIGDKLKELICDKFLGRQYKNESLDWVGELAIDQSSLIEVQSFIHEIFNVFTPSEFHLIIPKFNWRAIFTTNYDLILETAYQKQNDRLQELIPFLGNHDVMDTILRAKEKVAYIKLHGCISYIKDDTLPLILSLDQFVDYDTKRGRLFRILEDLAIEYPIIFVGHRLQDYNLRKILLRLNKTYSKKPRFYIIQPDVSDAETKYWESKRITVLNHTFKEFLNSIDSSSNQGVRVLQKSINIQHPLEKKFVVSENIPKNVLDYLNNDAVLIHSTMPIDNGTPQSFYKGFDLGWYPIINNLDVIRTAKDKILFDSILNEHDRPTKVDLYVIKAEAGAGKTILLRRLAYESAINADLIVIYLKKYGSLNYDIFYEISRLTDSRIFVFIDNAADNYQEIEYLISRAKKDDIALTLVTAERVNEWNMSCENIDPYVTTTYTLPYLSEKEIEKLIQLLEVHNSLGYLKSLSSEERKSQLKNIHGRQILVALHEATMGRPFEEILINEYREIRPQLAQSLYLSVCILNRLKIHVRAGLISRVHNVNFDEFKKKLFNPLEHVVHVIEDDYGNYFYTARHSQIAELVFERILSDPNDRYSEYVKMLGALNLAYNTDNNAFRQLVKGRDLARLFPDYYAVEEIYKIAEKLSPNDSFVYQQHGIYELVRTNGNLKKAQDYLDKANELAEEDLSVIHSLAELARIRAERANNSFEKERFRKESIKLANRLISDYSSRVFGFYTLVKIYLDQFREELNNPEITLEQIDRTIKNIENYLSEGLQQFPDDAHLLSCESDFYELMQIKEKAIKALEKAFELNKRDPFITSRLSKSYEAIGNSEGAINVIKLALERNPNEKRLHFKMAMYLKNDSEAELDSILYHFKRSFTKWDSNYEAQFWFARYAFESFSEDNIKESKVVFKKLRNARIAHNVRIKIKDTIKNESGENKVFKGTLKSKEYTFGFIQVEGFGVDVFTHIEHLDDELWANLRENQMVEFNIGFNFGGAIALNIKPS
ncbi:MAG: SIR2 family protein [Melioribacteraceae bacterium]|nr:SIR2 family protein [Melioribacteraceae bacterium]